jgi:hypothetical protein
MKLRKIYGNQYVKVMPFLKKYLGIPFIALLILAQAQLIIAAWAIEAKNIVAEVWANMDNTAYERTIVIEKRFRRSQPSSWRGSRNANQAEPTTGKTERSSRTSIRMGPSISENSRSIPHEKPKPLLWE